MKDRKPRIGLFVPCFNVGAEVSALLDQIPVDVQNRIEEIVVIDNQSTDGSRALLETLHRNWQGCPLVLIFNRQNYKLGGSTQIAFDWGFKNKWDFLICMHGDGQASPHDLPEFIKRIESNPSLDFVLGSRLLSESRVSDYSWMRQWGNRVFVSLQQIVMRNKMQDIGAFIAFNLRTISELPFRKISADMGYQVNLILSASRSLNRPLLFEEFPIYWGPVRQSTVNPWIYAGRHLVRLFRLALGRSVLLEKDFRYEIDVHGPRIQ